MAPGGPASHCVSGARFNPFRVNLHGPRETMRRTVAVGISRKIFTFHANGIRAHVSGIAVAQHRCIRNGMACCVKHNITGFFSISAGTPFMVPLWHCCRHRHDTAPAGHRRVASARWFCTVLGRCSCSSGGPVFLERMNRLWIQAIEDSRKEGFGRLAHNLLLFVALNGSGFRFMELT